MTDPGRSPSADPAHPAATPGLVVVGSASRDLTDEDPRGWRLGGGVSYSALTAARLGLRVGAVIGVDRVSATADELDLLRAAGVDVRIVVLDHAPVFVNLERPGGRVQVAHDGSDPLPLEALPDAWRAAPAWILAPVAGELPPGWAGLPADAATVAVGWQGLLRNVEGGGAPVTRIAPRRGALLARADLVGLSRDDVDPAIELAALVALLRPGAILVVTQGDRGGILARADRGTSAARGAQTGLRLDHYPAIPSPSVVDPTGAGDVFLAALTAARVEPRLVGGRIGQGFDRLLAAAAASLVVEGPGLAGVPDRARVRRRMAEGLARSHAATTAAADDPP